MMVGGDCARGLVVNEILLKIIRDPFQRMSSDELHYIVIELSHQPQNKKLYKKQTNNQPNKYKNLHTYKHIITNRNKHTETHTTMQPNIQTDQLMCTF